MLLKVGDPPVTVHGTYSIHVFSPGVGDAQLQNTHFIDEPTSWQPVIQLDLVSVNEGIVIDLAGSVRLIGSDTSAMASLVPISQKRFV